MPKKPEQRRSVCPINYALEIFGDRWTLLVVRDLVFEGKRTFTEFAESDEQISTNILTDRIMLLEREGIISKSPNQGRGSKYRYDLTEKGFDLLPILVEIILWSGKHDADTVLPKAYVQMIKRDKAAFIKNAIKAYKDGGSVKPK
ncbi:helix-turn-helix transcriptional regulator [Candidatus Kaiserbacteria bacterium]|nr:helix-turn-helix transcriptional regulator [Candidatus Kaiserbacteria bacterium]